MKNQIEIKGMTALVFDENYNHVRLMVDLVRHKTQYKGDQGYFLNLGPEGGGVTSSILQYIYQKCTANQ